VRRLPVGVRAEIGKDPFANKILLGDSITHNPSNEGT
jgi:hypothetical protein